MMYMKGYVGYFQKPPESMGQEEILNYLRYLKEERQASWSGINIAYSALKFFYTNILNRTWDVKKVPRPKLNKMLPAVLSRQEVKSILESTTNRKHRIALMTAYSGGLRISETTNLKVENIDSQLMQIRIINGKGNKDRYTILSTKLLEELREYYKRERPREWLFPGKDERRPIHQSTLQRAFKEAKKKLRLIKMLQYIHYATVLPLTY